MIDLAHKDLGIALDVANQLHVPMPLGAAPVKFYTWRGPQAAVGKTGAPSWNRCASAPG
ncbi:oxidoreductase [Salmonella enterica subsp. enterica]|uniref:Oxidoreductase n=1 Tax=Salmonella enterica I TaxID=59201 RepID=A0A379V0K3_SALET|nr:oxidoreductase [Salmonella enterica subsp. enterica]